MNERIEEKIMDAIKENGFNNSIIFLVNSREKENKKMDATALAACAGDLNVLHECISIILEKDDKIYEFFVDAVENARISRNKKDPNVN